MTDNSLVQIKGIKEGLLVTFGEADWNILSQALLTQVEKQQAFFKGARMVMDVNAHVLKSREIGNFRDKLSDLGINLDTILSTSEVTVNSAQLLGLGTQLPKPVRRYNKGDASVDMADHALFLDKTLRSGSRIEHAGNVVILGDVNPGAEVIAGGSVIVWGKVRGFVHAGSEGRMDVAICALDLSPTQLRINNEIAVSPPKTNEKCMPEMVRLVDGQIVAEAWKPN